MKVVSESSALLPMESLLTSIVTICLGASEDASVKTYFMNGPLFISKPHCYTKSTIAFDVMSTGNTNESSLENTPIKFTSPCVITTFNTIRVQSFPFY